MENENKNLVPMVYIPNLSEIGSTHIYHLFMNELLAEIMYKLESDILTRNEMYITIYFYVCIIYTFIYK